MKAGLLATHDRPGSYDPAMDNAILLGVGAAHAVAEDETPRGRYCGRIILPDSEQRSGYRDWYVYQPAAARQSPRPLGFRRP